MIYNLKIKATLNKNFSGYFVFSTHKDCWKFPISHYSSFEVIRKLNCLLLLKKKSPSEFLVEQRVKGDEKQAKRNKQRAKTNEQRSKTNEKRAKNNEQRAKINKQRAKYNEQRAKSNEQRAEANKQRATSKKFHLIFKNLWKSHFWST